MLKILCFQLRLGPPYYYLFIIWFVWGLTEEELLAAEHEGELPLDCGVQAGAEYVLHQLRIIQLQGQPHCLISFAGFRVLVVRFVFGGLWAVYRVADPQYFNGDPDLPFHFNADPDPDLNFNADADPDLRPLVYTSRAPFWASRLYCESLRPSTALFWLKLLNLTYIRFQIQHFTLMRIRIQLPKIKRIHADPETQPWQYPSKRIVVLCYFPVGIPILRLRDAFPYRR